MINSIADLINALAWEGNEINKESPIKHRPTIGDMYEGLTESLLQKAIFDGLNLFTGTGSFIKNAKGEMSHEIDVVLSVGPGEQVPYTSSFIFKPEQVVAVFQVKKTMHSNELRDALANLYNITTLYDNDRSLNLFEQELLDYAGRSICRKTVSPETIMAYTDIEGAVVGELKKEACLPVRIVLGYNGFTSMEGLRDGFYKLLGESMQSADNTRRINLTPGNLPTQVICGMNSIIKNNGMPYGYPMNHDRWDLLVTMPGHPFKVMLEYIWTRLAFMFKLDPLIFGDDLTTERVNPFMHYGLNTIGSVTGWDAQLVELSKEQLAKDYEESPWQPVEVSKEQAAIIKTLIRYETLPTLVPQFEALAASLNTTREAIIVSLCHTGLISHENNELRLLTVKLGLVVTPDRKIYAGEDESGRLTRWLRANYPNHPQL